MVPTVIRLKSTPHATGLVVTVLGNGRLEARFQAYRVGDDGQTALLSDEFWSTEALAIAHFDGWVRELAE
jgi:hypothetical protein